MAAHVRTVEIPDADRQELRRRARSKGAPARVVERARIVLLSAQVIGNDAAIAFAGASGSFELNVMLPVMARNLLESITLVGNAARHLADKTVVGIVANVERCRQLAESSPSIVTPLNRKVGYEAAAKIAKHSVADGLTIREAVIALGFVERGEVSLDELSEAQDVLALTAPLREA